MRNLKKILALVLALVMSLSLMATAGASSFSDVEAGNQYETAIDVLDALKVFIGYTDGTFQPDGELTRAEAAVLVYRIATGDVEGKYVDNYTYMVNNKFTDLTGYGWAVPYINYCQNAEIVVGTSATTFSPGMKVTGYQLMVMVLRTLGYGKAGEFSQPGKWELETAAKCESLGMLKNVTTGDFGAPAKRAMVAEILFQGLLQETVTYSTFTSGGYTKTGTTLGKQELGLEEVRGVVVANEYASLDSTSTLADGKTKLANGYTLNYTTDLNDIGEAKVFYTKDSAKNTKDVLAYGDGGNTVEQSYDSESVSDILGRAGISGSGAERYINFNQTVTSSLKNDIRIKYTMKMEIADLVTEGYEVASDNGEPAPASDVAAARRAIQYELDRKTAGVSTTNVTIYDNADAVVVSIPAKNELNDYTGANYSTTDYAVIEHVITPNKELSTASIEMTDIAWIFSNADADSDYENSHEYFDGEVYVGTQSYEDISDKISYEKFLEDYFTGSDVKASFDANDNGNWVKVIDNNGDGVADYIFKVIYTVAQVDRVKDDTVTLDVKNRDLTTNLTSTRVYPKHAQDSINTLTNQPVKCADTLEEGNVVYYAVIDGKAQTYLTTTETATIDKVDRNKKTALAVGATDPWTQSDVCNHIENGDYESGVTNLRGNVSYDLFFDAGNYLVAFVRSDLSSNFKLITDGWFNSTKNDGYEYAVKVYNDETKGMDIVDITNGNGDLFISGQVSGVLNNNWNALKFLGGTSESNGALNNLVSHLSHAGNGNTELKAGAALNGAAITCDNTTGTPVERNNVNRIKTTVASITADGEIYPVDSTYVNGRANHAMIDMDNNVIPTSAQSTGDLYVTRNSSDTAYQNTDYVNATVTNVRVRALSSTIYYVVSGTGHGEQLTVTTFEGYANAPKIDDSLIEDVYVVGTLRGNDGAVDTGSDNTYYYTADIVVIEAPNYTGGYEPVFVYDDPDNNFDVGIREIEVIRENGEKDTVKVYTGSHRVQSAIQKPNNLSSKYYPGMYKMTVWDANEEVYVLAPMTAAEIADKGFVVGQVNYFEGTTPADYLVMYPFYTDDDAVAPSFYRDTTTIELPLGKTPSEYMYNLSYGVGLNDYTKYTGKAASLSDGSYRDVLRGAVEGKQKGAIDLWITSWDNDVNYVNENRDSISGTQRYFFNDLLVHYDANGVVVWAVSMANAYNDNGWKPDFAQNAWAACVSTDPGESDSMYIPLTVQAASTDDGVEVEGMTPNVISYDEAAGLVKVKKSGGTDFFQFKVTPVGGTVINSIVINAPGCSLVGTPVFDGTSGYEVTVKYDPTQVTALADYDDNNVITTKAYVDELIAAIQEKVDAGTATEADLAELKAIAEGAVSDNSATDIGEKVDEFELAIEEAADKSDVLTLQATEAAASWLTVEDCDVASGTASLNVVGTKTINQVIAGLQVYNTEDDATEGSVAYAGEDDPTNIVDSGDIAVTITDAADGEYDVTITVTVMTAEQAEKAAADADIATAKAAIEGASIDPIKNTANAAVANEAALKTLILDALSGVTLPDSIDAIAAEDITITDPADLSGISSQAAGKPLTVKFTVDIADEAGKGTPATTEEVTVTVTWYKSDSDIKTAVKALVPTTCDTATVTDFDTFVGQVKAAITGDTVASVTGFDVTSSAPAQWQAGSLTLEYSFTYNGETLSDSVSVTLS